MRKWLLGTVLFIVALVILGAFLATLALDGVERADGSTARVVQQAIYKPVRGERPLWDFEPGLVDVMLADVEHEPGALPLLSHALLETWNNRRGRTMTFGGYYEAGGVKGAKPEDEAPPPAEVRARSTEMVMIWPSTGGSVVSRGGGPSLRQPTPTIRDRAPGSRIQGSCPALPSSAAKAGWDARSAPCFPISVTRC